MKVLIDNYSFNASAQQVTFSGYSSIDLERVLLITNVTDQEVIYLFADDTLGGTVSTNVLTLEYDTTGMSDTDDLQIWYEAEDSSSTAMVVGSITTLMTTELNSLTNGAGVDASSAWDNTDGSWAFGDFELVVGTASAMTAGATFGLYILGAPDGSNYCDDQENALAGLFICEAATAGRYLFRNVPIPPYKVKMRIVNNSGQNLNSSGNTLKVLPYRGA